MKVSQVFKLAQVLVLATGIGFTSMAVAGGGKAKCKETELPKASIINGGFLASKVIATINEKRKEAQARGDELDVVFIARTGTDPGSSRVLKDYGPNGRYLSLEDIYGHEKKDNHYWDIKKHFEPKNSKRKVVYSHLGLAFRNHPLADQIQAERNLPDKPWVMVHMLKPCGTLVPDLFDEGIWNFFLDDPYKYGAKVIIPSRDFQKRMQQVILDEENSYRYLAKKYNALALYTDLNEQNSNQWVLEAMAAALALPASVRSRRDAIQVLRELKYRPTRIYLKGKHQWAKSFGPDSVNFHTQRFGGKHLVEGVTVLSMVEFMKDHDLIVNEFPVELKEDEMILDDNKVSNSHNTREREGK